ncbi:class I SAM-dependent methyltransferase [Candidatus Peregrinibacteria bacterium]|nr:class I SAM-dependent methyltransferase [bacterium]NCQ54611.1 class I SAM-dependent methyltransferase [Candidatus Parcubacteria bacterium]NCS68090.1 class I SAM-dependent methyltransferase [Candidatus Peregrinibacteria bacterium]
MPFSDPDITFDAQLEKIIRFNNYAKYLDIGAGAGKYGLLIRNVFPEAFIEGIEADSEYIKQFSLQNIYNQIYNARVEYFFDDKPDYITEMVIIGDCLEHLKKSDGIDLINYLVYRCKCIAIIFPSKYVQYSWKGHFLEAHRSVWTKSDFIHFNYKYKKKKFMNLVIIQGYLADAQANFPKG